MILQISTIFIILLTSILSGVMGMGGGMILMGFLGFFFTPATAVIFHGITQLISNSSRAYINRNSISWTPLKGYIIGGLLSFGFFQVIEFQTTKTILFICLGSFGLFSFLKPISKRLAIEKNYNSILCGFLVCSGQIIAGAAGPLLDIFFFNSNLKRHQVVATKAVTQTLSHSIKILHYLLIIDFDFSKLNLEIGFVIVASLTPIIGSNLGKKYLDKMKESSFTKYSKYLILFISCVYILKGLTN